MLPALHSMKVEWRSWHEPAFMASITHQPALRDDVAVIRTPIEVEVAPLTIWIKLRLIAIAQQRLSFFFIHGLRSFFSSVASVLNMKAMT